MSLPPTLGGLAGLRAAALADAGGRILGQAGQGGAITEGAASTTAALVDALAAAGEVCGLPNLGLVQVRGGGRAALVAVRPDALLIAELDPVAKPHEIDRVLSAWAIEDETAPAPAAAPQPARTAAPAPEPAPAAPPPPPRPQVPAADPWAALRRSLVRGHLTEAASWQQAIERGTAPAGVPGGEPLGGTALREAMTRLLEGIGNVLAGDAFSGKSGLQPLTEPTFPNTSLRWVALHWSAQASMAGAGLDSARQLVQGALDLARQLDVEARAVSQLAAAELLLYAGKHDKALTWAIEARARFDRARDPWGQGRAWLVEARAHAALSDDAACLTAARQARAVDPAWDAPAIFLAGRALRSGDATEAESVLGELRTPLAARLRSLLAAVRAGTLGLGDAAEFLQLHQLAPTPHVLRSVERIANAWPRFLQAREALAWMLLRLGRYAKARQLFAWLDRQPVDAEEGALVKLGLSIIDAATKATPPLAAGGAPASGTTPPPIGLSESLVQPGTAEPGAGHDAVFQGRLSAFSLPDLVEFLRSARRSGLLMCSSPAGMGVLRFRHGYLTGSSASGQPSLTEQLLRAGQLDAGAASQVAGEGLPDHELGGLLLERGLVGAEPLAAAIRLQIEGTLRALLGWSDGEFAFSREVVDSLPEVHVGVQVDAQELLLRVFKELDEAARIPATPAS